MSTTTDENVITIVDCIISQKSTNSNILYRRKV